MPRRFQSQVERLGLLASTAAWRIAILEVHDLLAELDAALGNASYDADAAADADGANLQGLMEMRHALDRNLRTLETAMAAALAKLAASDIA